MGAERQLIQEMHKAEDRIRSRVARQVKQYSHEEIEAISDDLEPPKRSCPDYRRYAHV